MTFKIGLNGSIGIEEMGNGVSQVISIVFHRKKFTFVISQKSLRPNTPQIWNILSDILQPRIAAPKSDVLNSFL